MTTVCTCGFIFESGTFPPLDRTLVIRAISCVGCWQTEGRAGEGPQSCGCHLLSSESLASLDPAISLGLQLFGYIASVLAEPALISEFSGSHSRLKTTGWNLIGINVKSRIWVQKNPLHRHRMRRLRLNSEGESDPCIYLTAVLCASSWPSLTESNAGSLNKDHV